MVEALRTLFQPADIRFGMCFLLLSLLPSECRYLFYIYGNFIYLFPVANFPSLRHGTVDFLEVYNCRWISRPIRPVLASEDKGGSPVSVRFPVPFLSPGRSLHVF